MKGMYFKPQTSSGHGKKGLSDQRQPPPEKSERTNRAALHPSFAVVFSQEAPKMREEKSISREKTTNGDALEVQQVQRHQALGGLTLHDGRHEVPDLREEISRQEDPSFNKRYGLAKKRDSYSCSPLTKNE